MRKFFAKSKNRNTGVHSFCNPCKLEYNAKYRKNNPDKVRNAIFKSKYKITLKDYFILLKQQNKVCAICKGPNSTKSGFMSIDHNHKTGKVRGLLCNTCNLTLGTAKDSIRILRSAIKYLKNNPAKFLYKR